MRLKGGSLDEGFFSALEALDDLLSGATCYKTCKAGTFERVLGAHLSFQLSFPEETFSIVLHGMRRAILTSDTDPIEVWLVSTKNQANALPDMAAANAQHLAMGALPETPAPLSPGVLFKAEGAAHPTGAPLQLCPSPKPW